MWPLYGVVCRAGGAGHGGTLRADYRRGELLLRGRDESGGGIVLDGREQLAQETDCGIGGCDLCIGNQHMCRDTPAHMAKYLFESGIAAIQEVPSSAPRIHTHTHTHTHTLLSSSRPLPNESRALPNTVLAVISAPTSNGPTWSTGSLSATRAVRSAW